MIALPTLKSVSWFACYQSNDAPNTSHREFTQNQSKKEGKRFSVGFDSAMPENNPFQSPTDEKRKPQFIEMIVPGQRIAQRMQWPPKES